MELLEQWRMWYFSSQLGVRVHKVLVLRAAVGLRIRMGDFKVYKMELMCYCIVQIIFLL